MSRKKSILPIVVTGAVNDSNCSNTVDYIGNNFNVIVSNNIQIWIQIMQ